MAQIIIDVNGAPTLFSPVLAHALEPGDLIHALGDTTRIVSTGHRSRRCVHIIDSADTYWLPLNSSVLRAVGARAGRGGAR